jgi:hypothetical protein
MSSPIRAWYFESRVSGYRRTEALWLYPELDCSSCVDDCESDDGEDQLAYYVRYVVERYPHWWETDAVPIIWSVRGKTTHEAAPFNPDPVPWGDFLYHFTWPEDHRTGEALDWFTDLLVRNRFPAFASALGWLPSPFQRTAPLRSIVASREGRLSWPTIEQEGSRR